jgi:hypothetical protein
MELSDLPLLLIAYNNVNSDGIYVCWPAMLMKEMFDLCDKQTMEVLRHGSESIESFGGGSLLFQ